MKKNKMKETVTKVTLELTQTDREGAGKSLSTKITGELTDMMRRSLLSDILEGKTISHVNIIF